jgi:hypothetical protein
VRANHNNRRQGCKDHVVVCVFEAQTSTDYLCVWLSIDIDIGLDQQFVIEPALNADNCRWYGCCRQGSHCMRAAAWKNGNVSDLQRDPEVVCDIDKTW